jgi:hypothetical protein
MSSSGAVLRPPHFWLRAWRCWSASPLPCTTTGSGVAGRGFPSPLPPTRLVETQLPTAMPLTVGEIAAKRAHIMDESCSGTHNKPGNRTLPSLLQLFRADETSVARFSNAPSPPALTIVIFTRKHTQGIRARRNSRALVCRFLSGQMPVNSADPCVSFLLERSERQRVVHAEQARDLPRSTTAPASSFCCQDPSFGAVERCGP